MFLQNYQLIITGHSLGAGVAAILAVLLKPAYPYLHCYAYSPPGCIFRYKLYCYGVFSYWISFYGIQINITYMYQSLDSVCMRTLWNVIYSIIRRLIIAGQIIKFEEIYVNYMHDFFF